ncbi:collagen binding domain-containing protein, partial [Carnobacterium maltaromaticum]|uniref:collagen binding domain-containing protein n=2 Tax=Carnobacterium maltaromaticum TaxID=2751 RepID=UPI00191B9CB9
MIRKWNFFGLIVLLMQVFSPLVVVAETIKEVNSFELTKITAQSDKNGSASSFIVEIFGEVLTQESETKNITVSENFKITNLNGSVTDLAGQEIGSYQVSQNQLSVSLIPNVKGQIKMSIPGELINPTIREQTITVTNEMESVATQVTIATPSTPNEPDLPQPEASLTPETPIVPITEATGKFETIAPKREAIDIQTLFPSTSGQTSLITSMTINDEKGNPIEVTTIGDFLKFNLDFSLPEDIRTQMQVGDYFEFSLPDQIKISQNQSFPLTNSDGVQYATATIGVDGKVRITFNEKVTEESDIFGNFNFEGELDPNNITGTGPNHIETPFVDNQPGIDITVKPDVTSSVDKKGAFDKIPNPNKVTWNVDINKALDEITNASLTEAIPDGLTFETFKIYQVTVDLKGKVIEGSEVLVDPSEYTVDATGNVTFKNKINGAYRLTYETTINDDKKPGAEGGTVKFENKVTFDGDEIAPILATASVTASYKKALEKGKPGYNPDKQTFDWTINYNFTEYKIKESQATVSDTINGNMSLLSDSVSLNKVTFDAKGNAIEGAPLVLGQDYTLVPKADGKGFDIQFNQDIDYAVAIHYTTKVNEVIDQDTDYSNTVEDGSGNQDSETGHAKQQGLIKNVDYVDNSAKAITWKIDINKNNYQMENWTMTDQLSPGLTLNKQKFAIQNISKGGIPLELGQDYTLNYDQETNRFTIVFINNYLNTSDTFTILYQTTYNFEAMNEAGETTFYNNASSDWISNTDNTHKNPGDTAEFLPNDESGNDGFKFGEYNAVAKAIKWTLGVNYSRVDLENAKVTDPIKGNQKYLPGSLKIFKYQITPDGGYIKGAEVTGVDFEKFGITEPSASNNQTLTIVIPDGPMTDQYLFEYQTSLVGEIIKDSAEYDNTATTTNNGHQDYDVTGTVSIANGGSFADKSGKQDADGFVNWSVTVNPSQSTISDVVVKDNPS